MFTCTRKTYLANILKIQILINFTLYPLPPYSRCNGCQKVLEKNSYSSWKYCHQAGILLDFISLFLVFKGPLGIE